MRQEGAGGEGGKRMDFVISRKRAEGFGGRLHWFSAAAACAEIRPMRAITAITRNIMLR